MSTERQNILNEFSNLLTKINVEINSNEDHLVIKELNNSNKENTISKIDYYSKRYLRSNKDIFEKDDKDFSLAYLDKTFEDLFFKKLIGIGSSKIHHYTSFQALIQILQNRKIRLSSIAGLNDRDELHYFDVESNHEIKDEYHYKRIEACNHRFLLSCSYLQDDLNQWRLYGNDGCGVSIEFKIADDISDFFYIGKILYGNQIIQDLNEFIENVYQEYNVAFVFNRFSIWKHFFKSKDWSYEKEVRILYSNPKVYIESEIEWAINRYNILAKYQFVDMRNMPIHITGITLGPKLSENELNKAQLKQFLRENNYLDLLGNIKSSTIKCYR